MSRSGEKICIGLKFNLVHFNGPQTKFKIFEIPVFFDSPCMFGLVRKYLSACQLSYFCGQGPDIGISQLPVYSLVAPRPAAAHVLLDLGDDPAGPGVVVPLVDQPLEHLHTEHIMIIIINML